MHYHWCSLQQGHLLHQKSLSLSLSLTWVELCCCLLTVCSPPYYLWFDVIVTHLLVCMLCTIQSLLKWIYRQKWIRIYSQVFQLSRSTSSKRNMRWNLNNSSSVQRKLTGRLSICQRILLMCKKKKRKKHNNGRHQLSSWMGCLSYYWLKINNYVRLRTVKRNWGSKVFMFLLLKYKIDNGDRMLSALINQIKWYWLGNNLYYMTL